MTSAAISGEISRLRYLIPSQNNQFNKHSMRYHMLQNNPLWRYCARFFNEMGGIDKVPFFKVAELFFSTAE